ncbi:hypothetical protein PYK79_31695 [Streptomyces sp. ID05-04B]|nr:hypothetical protein [Streptomyces sp. ID05-04B]
MSEEKRAGQTSALRSRVPNGHNYCWAEHSSGVRCCQPRGHSGRHEHPYVPRQTW